MSVCVRVPACVLALFISLFFGNYLEQKQSLELSQSSSITFMIHMTRRFFPSLYLPLSHGLFLLLLRDNKQIQVIIK